VDEKKGHRLEKGIKRNATMDRTAPVARRRQFDLVVYTIRLQFSEQGSFFPEKLQV
jgi:hypothetical protein